MGWHRKGVYRQRIGAPLTDWMRWHHWPQMKRVGVALIEQRVARCCGWWRNRGRCKGSAQPGRPGRNARQPAFHEQAGWPTPQGSALGVP